jgi:hypothetical protein
MELSILLIRRFPVRLTIVGGFVFSLVVKIGV